MNWNNMTNDERISQIGSINEYKDSGKTWDDIGELYSTTGEAVKKFYHRNKVSRSVISGQTSGQTLDKACPNATDKECAESFFSPFKKKYVLLDNNEYNPNSERDTRKPIAYFNCAEDLLNMTFLDGITIIERMRKTRSTKGLAVDNTILEEKMKEYGITGWCWFYGSDTEKLRKDCPDTPSRWINNTRYWIKKNTRMNEKF